MVETSKRRPLYSSRHMERGLVRETNFRGTVVWYYRQGAGKRTRIGGGKGYPAHGTPEFKAAYEAAARGKPVDVRQSLPGNDPQSLGWLIAEYRKSTAWPANRQTARNYDQSLRHLNAILAFRSVTKEDIEATRDFVAKATPVQAIKFVSHVRALYAWAIDKKLATVDPTLGVSVKAIRRAHETESHHSWSEEEIAKFEARWPQGTRERLALALLVYTGQRISDVVLMGRQHIDRDGVMSVRQVKTRKPAHVPVHDALKAELAAAPTGDLTFLVMENGKALSAEYASKWFSAACEAAGLVGCTAHGLRHAATARALEAGATVGNLMAMFGYRLEVAAGYAKDFDARRDARKNAHLLGRRVA